MNKRVGIAAAAAVIALAAIALFYPGIGAGTGLFTLYFAAPNYSIDSMSVYQSDSNVIGSGSAVCTGVDISGISASCDTNLLKNGIYRFELTISNSGNQVGYPDQAIFLNTYSAGDVLGSDANLLYCGCLDDGTYKKGTPAFVGNDVNCSLVFDDQCKIEKTSGSEVFYFVIGVGSDPLTGTGSFYINDEDKAKDDLSAETAFSYCIPACYSDVGCDDGNILRTYSCDNPGTCSASCSFTVCDVECYNDDACDDGLACTSDSCNDAGTCSASCSNTEISACTDDDGCCPSGCNAANDNDCSASCGDSTCDSGENCSSCPDDCSCTGIQVCCDSICIDSGCVEGGCNDSNSLTVDTCTNPGTCNAACSHTLCDIECSSNIECDDSNSFTLDTCANAGTCSASCTYASCTPACFSNTDCGDGVSNTVDTCNNPGTCDANCTNVICTPECNSDADCDDLDQDTEDICIHPGGCGAHCIHNYCVPECETDAECDDGDPATNDFCLNAGSCTATCSIEGCDIACSSDSDCDDSKLATKDVCNNPGTCAAACAYSKQKQFLFEFVSDFNAVERGQIIDLNIILKDLDSNPVEGAEISFTDSEGNEIEFESIGSGYYSGSYAIPADVVLGSQTLSFLASKGELVGAEDLVLEVEKGSIKAVLIEPSEPTALVGEKLELKFKVVYGSNEIVEDANVSAEMNGVSIPLAMDSNGVFAGHYFFSDSDLEGASLVIAANDSAGNSGTTTIAFSVRQPLPISTLLIALALLAAVLIAVYGLKRTHRLSTLLHRMERIKGATRAAKLQHSIAKEKNQRENLVKKIAQQEKDLAKVKLEIDAERRKQALAIQKMPMESKYAVHGAGVGFVSKLKKIFSKAPEKTEGQLQTEKRLGEIDTEVTGLRAKIKNLEAEYCKQTIKEDFFRKKLFDYREKIHLLELEKKKIE